MSLINSANFVAPLRSRVRIIGLLGFALLVAVMRYASTGAVDPTRATSQRGVPGSRGAPAAVSSGDPEIDSYLQSRRHVRSRDTMIGDTTVEELLDPNARPIAPSRRDVEEDRPENEPQKLNDIKRSLGLE